MKFRKYGGEAAGYEHGDGDMKEQEMGMEEGEEFILDHGEL